MALPPHSGTGGVPRPRPVPQVRARSDQRQRHKHSCTCRLCYGQGNGQPARRLLTRVLRSRRGKIRRSSRLSCVCPSHVRARIFNAHGGSTTEGLPGRGESHTRSDRRLAWCSSQGTPAQTEAPIRDAPEAPRGWYPPPHVAPSSHAAPSCQRLSDPVTLVRPFRVPCTIVYAGRT